jgi:CMP-N-acetylneuraminic acid synthetase
LKIVAFVPIKLNSQRVKNKNLLPLGGKPLCWHIFESLLHAEGLDQVYCYCSEERIRESIPEEVTFLKRDPALDGQMVKGMEIYGRFIRDVDADIYVLCHATSPFIRSETISRALAAVCSGEYDSAFAAQRLQTFAWYQGKPLNYDPHDIPRTQDIEPVFVETSAFFVFRKEVYTKLHRRVGLKPYVCETDNMESVDIDEPEDYEFAVRLAEGVFKK